MFHLRIPPSWQLPESLATPEQIYLRRREFLRGALGAGAGALLLPSLAHAAEDEAERGPWTGVKDYPRKVERNPAYAKLDRPLSEARDAASFNNFYEFSLGKEDVWPLAQKLTTDPWSIEVAGHAKNTGKLDLDDLLKKLPQEERLYRFRCVETWAMAVPWIGIPMRAFLKHVEPTSKARYVRFLTFLRPKEAPNQADGPYKDVFPYYEALRIEEADNELTLLATGLYGKRLPRQNGAPVRLVVPWKYGYKSPKSIVRIEFTEKRPPTFWNDLQPGEYGWLSNVDPAVPHPRWSQKFEWMLPSRADRRETRVYNGYSEQVASLYRKPK